MSELVLNNFIEEYEWADLPSKIISREGESIHSFTNLWHLPYTLRQHSCLDFNKFINPMLRWVIKKHIQEKIQITSTHAGYVAFQDIWREVFKFQKTYELSESLSPVTIKENLISLFEYIIAQARSKHRLWALYRSIQWYIWCAENYPELGFCCAYALELEAMDIPGNPKGEAVRMEDLEAGPLHRSLELPLLIKTLKEDKSLFFEHLQQKAAIALSIALGRNPANLTFLKERDLINLAPVNTEPCYIIKMPRIKKRQLNPRDDLMDESLDAEFAGYLEQLIHANQSINLRINSPGGAALHDKPLFIKLKMNKSALASGMLKDAFNMHSSDITELIKKFALRHQLISPLTGKPLHLSARRLRYTLATSLAAEGISKKELARLLDHTDTQHVHVYFEVASNIVEHLDKATAKGFAHYLNLFKGQLIDSPEQAINGSRDDKLLSFVNEENPKDHTEIGICGEHNICHPDPPFSCYLCPKFQPYRHADHEHVLECLLASRQARMEKYEQARLGVQLDDVIIAVAQVAQACKKEVSDV